MADLTEHDDLPPPPPSTVSTSYIGTAYMNEEGTIELRLRTDDHVTIGHGVLTYPKDHPDYLKILSHLGGLRPGEHKPVSPWITEDK